MSLLLLLLLPRLLIFYTVLPLRIKHANEADLLRVRIGELALASLFFLIVFVLLLFTFRLHHLIGIMKISENSGKNDHTKSIPHICSHYRPFTHTHRHTSTRPHGFCVEICETTTPTKLHWQYNIFCVYIIPVCQPKITFCISSQYSFSICDDVNR